MLSYLIMISFRILYLGVGLLESTWFGCMSDKRYLICGLPVGLFIGIACSICKSSSGLTSPLLSTTIMYVYVTCNHMAEV